MLILACVGLIAVGAITSYRSLDGYFTRVRLAGFLVGTIAEALGVFMLVTLVFRG